ncbi:MAG: cob(I)yrinic acid a,c-diamide adenosyltransferase [Verrucomicrobiota bacterium]
MSITTGRGDDGQTDLLFGKTAPKDSPRIEAVGAVDELNAALGLARVQCACAARLAVIDRVQEKLVGLMGELATLPEDMGRYREKGFPMITSDDVAWVTAESQAREAAGVRFTGWARPGAEGSAEKAALDYARTVARRAERSVLSLDSAEGGVPLEVKLFLNRISDLCWVMARSD